MCLNVDFQRAPSSVPHSQSASSQELAVMRPWNDKKRSKDPVAGRNSIIQYKPYQALPMLSIKASVLPKNSQNTRQAPKKVSVVPAPRPGKRRPAPDRAAATKAWIKYSRGRMVLLDGFRLQGIRLRVLF